MTRRRVAAFAAGALFAAVAVAELRTYESVDITNFRLGPEYAQWLVGPIVHVASAEERRQFLALTEDEAAAEFIEAFWDRRGPNLKIPPSGPRVTFERRAEEADKRFTEGTFLGRRTDRGTVFILYGSPEVVEYASSPIPEGEPVEVWAYPKAAAPGLDGQRPDRRYAFRRDGAVTKFFPLAALKRMRRVPSRGRDIG